MPGKYAWLLVLAAALTPILDHIGQWFSAIIGIAARGAFRRRDIAALVVIILAAVSIVLGAATFAVILIHHT